MSLINEALKQAQRQRAKEQADLAAPMPGSSGPTMRRSGPNLSNQTLVLLAGGGIRPGIVHGATDDFGYNAIQDVVHVRDLHATMLHLLGIDHMRFTVQYQGLDSKLTGVEPAKPVRALLA